jgi:hypothetical protein
VVTAKTVGPSWQQTLEAEESKGDGTAVNEPNFENCRVSERNVQRVEVGVDHQKTDYV